MLYKLQSGMLINTSLIMLIEHHGPDEYVARMARGYAPMGLAVTATDGAGILASEEQKQSTESSLEPLAMRLSNAISMLRITQEAMPENRSHGLVDLYQANGIPNNEILRMSTSSIASKVGPRLLAEGHV